MREMTDGNRPTHLGRGDGRLLFFAVGDYRQYCRDCSKTGRKKNPELNQDIKRVVCHHFPITPFHKGVSAAHLRFLLCLYFTI
ncbi:hypothetical protein [Salisediminibacterium halotolerans]|uniref:hypothetical protein n=1 Tax=Salisediminibacterium halotolerans TaxID=517425 RepID=UPI000F50C035|nr:hypothetical protein [Salisediminibacterium halotolerans]GEL07706.1 hypothetical protein SHA02_11220 [Salisediminibacterium halotolerans]